MFGFRICSQKIFMKNRGIGINYKDDLYIPIDKGKSETEYYRDEADELPAPSYSFINTRQMSYRDLPIPLRRI